MKRFGWIIVLFLMLGGCSSTVEVETRLLEFSSFEKTLEEDGQTRLSQSYSVNMPINGELPRLEWKAGDRVQKGEFLFALEDRPYQLQEQRAELELEATQVEREIAGGVGPLVSQKRSLSAQIKALEQRSQSLVAQKELFASQIEQAKVDQKRSQNLYREGAIAKRSLENATLHLKGLASQKKVLDKQNEELGEQKRSLRYQQEALQAQIDETLKARRLAQVKGEGAKVGVALAQRDRDRLKVYAPVTGTVLKKFVDGPTTAVSGTPVLLLGASKDLEVAMEVLTDDALFLKVGMKVELSTKQGWQLGVGEIERIEPVGYTDLSSLGVKEQKVLVVVSWPDPPQGVGIAYEIRGTFLLEKREKVLLLPSYSVVKEKEGNFVFVVEKGHLKKKKVTLGERSSGKVVLLEGLSEGEEYLLFPSKELEEGLEVKGIKVD